MSYIWTGRLQAFYFTALAGVGWRGEELLVWLYARLYIRFKLAPVVPLADRRIASPQQSSHCVIATTAGTAPTMIHVVLLGITPWLAFGEGGLWGWILGAGPSCAVIEKGEKQVP